MKPFWISGFFCVSLFVGGLLFGMSIRASSGPDDYDDEGYSPRPAVVQKCCKGCKCGCARYGYRCGDGIGAKGADGEAAFACPGCERLESQLFEGLPDKNVREWHGEK